MQWSKLKKRFESLLAPSLRGRIQVHLTEYTKTNQFDVGRGWVTLDGKEIVSVQIPSFYSNNITFSTETLDFGKALSHYLSLSIDEARASTDSLVCGFAFLDRRLGKRSLASTNTQNLHEFSRILYGVRCVAENIPR